MNKISLIKSALLSTLLVTGAFAATQPLDRIVVVVNDDVVTQQELDSRLAYVKQQYQSASRPLPAEEVITKQIIDALILESLQLQLADKAKITIPDQQIDSTVSSIAARQKMTAAQFYQAMRSRGFSENDIRDQIRDEMTISEVQRQLVARQVYVSDAEVERFLQTQSGQSLAETQYQLSYRRFELDQQAEANALLKKLNDGATLADEEGSRDLGMRSLEDIPSIFRTLVPVLNNQEAVMIERNGALHMAQLANKTDTDSLNVEEFQIRHILIKTDLIFDEDAAISLLEEIRSDILAGASMAELADEYSQDDGSRGRGGLLDWRTLDSYVTEFSDTVKTTPLGEISEVFESPFGFHILQVEDSRLRDVSVDVLKQQIRSQLSQKRYNEALERWKTELVAESFIEHR